MWSWTGSFLQEDLKAPYIFSSGLQVNLLRDPCSLCVLQLLTGLPLLDSQLSVAMHAIWLGLRVFISFTNFCNFYKILKFTL